MAFERTAAVIDKTLKDLAKISYWITLSVQVVFLGLYGYKIYINLDKLIYLVIYSVISLVSIFGFIYYLVTYKKKKHKAIIGTKLGVRISKYLANATMIIVILIEFTQYGASDLGIVISGISIVSFAIQIIFEIIRFIYGKYSELIATAISMDSEKYVNIIDKLSNKKELFLSVVDAPIRSVSDKIDGIKKEKKPLTKVELYVDQLASEYKAKKNVHRALRVKKAKDDIKKHFKNIFSFFKLKKKVKKSVDKHTEVIKRIE